MAIYEIELPDGRTAEIELPEGMTIEQAAQEVDQLYQANPNAFGGAPAQPQQQAPAQPPGMLSRIEQAASQYFPLYGVPKGMFGEGETAGGLENYGRGVARGLQGVGTGIRQGWNALTGDTEELAQLNQQEAAARQQFQQDTGGGFMAGAGQFVGGAAPAVVASAAGAGAPAMPILASMGLGAGAGALGGATSALTPEEEAGGKRGRNALYGAALGAAVPAVGGAVNKARNLARRVTPEAATADFAERALGASRERGAAPAYRALREATDNTLDDLGKKFGALYQQVEDIPGAVRLNSSAGSIADDLPEEVLVKANPATRRIAEALRGASTHKSPIVDVQGKPIQFPKDVSFRDAREAARELKAAARDLGAGGSDAGRAQSARIKMVIDRLESDIDDWARATGNEGALSAAKDVDRLYRAEVAPFRTAKTKIGQYALSKTDDLERATKSAFLGKDTGEAVSDLVGRVPGAKDPLRELYGQELLKSRGPVASANAIRGGTTGEALLSKAEREYLDTVASAARESSQQGLTLSHTIEGLLRGTGMRKVSDKLTGVLKYGDKEGVNSTLANILRAYGLGQATTSGSE